MTPAPDDEEAVTDRETVPVPGHQPGPAAPRPGVDIDALRFDAAGLITVVVQQHDTGEVLMVAWADAAAIARTIEVGEAVFYSRSRQEQWHKGATSGNTQRLLEIRSDCDGDVLLYLVDQQGDGVACHTGARSCFHRQLEGAPSVPDTADPAPTSARSTP